MGRGLNAPDAVLDRLPIISEVLTRAWDDAVILNPACQPEFRLFPDLLDPHCQSGASQIDYFIRIVQTMGRHNDIALDSFAGPYRLVDQAIESVFADIAGLRSQGVTGAIADQVHGPMERGPRAPPSLDAGIPPRLDGRNGVGQRIAGCTGAHHSTRWRELSTLSARGHGFF
jgi:hypothetical protein